MPNERYTGRIKNVPNGFGFIEIGTVQREDGSDHGLATREDIFLPENECSAPLKPGMIVSFTVAPDARRGHGALKAVNAREVIEPALVPATGAVMPGFQWSLTTPRETAKLAHVSGDRHPHARMKPVPVEIVAKVIENDPMPDMPRDEQLIQLPDDPATVLAALEHYLFDKYHSLQAIDMDYRIVGYDEAAIDKLVAETAAGYREMDLHQQATLLEEEYASFKATRALLAWIVKNDLLRPGTQLAPSILSIIVKLVEETKDAVGKAGKVDKIRKVMNFMMKRGLLKPSTVIPNRYFVEHLMAVPIMYHVKCGPGMNEERINKEWKETDPLPNVATLFFCGLPPVMGNGQRWADTYQMFNRRFRTLKDYKGDMIPPHIMRIMREGREVFDYLTIMAPYLEEAGKDWQDIEWIKSIDPYLVGFVKGLNVYFILGRFSDTGVFPLFNELVADTMEFLRQNKDKLVGFDEVRQPYWMMDAKHSGHGHTKLGTHLIEHTNQMLAAFEAGHLFEWLRGEWDLPRTTSMQRNQPAVVQP